MAIALILGVLTGFVVSIPPGPVTATLIAKTVETGRRQSIQFACGAAICEILYASAAVWGAGLLISTTARELIDAAGFLLLLGMGIRYTFFDIIPDPQNKKPSFVTGSYVLGLMLPLTTPTIGVTYVVIAGFLHSNGLLHEETAARHAFAVGAGIGTFFWLATMMATVERFRHKARSNVVSLAARGAGVFLLLAAVYLGQILLFPLPGVAAR